MCKSQIPRWGMGVGWVWGADWPNLCSSLGLSIPISERRWNQTGQASPPLGPEGAQSPHFPEPAGGTRPPTMFGALPRLSCLQLASLCGDRQGQRAVFSQLLPQSSPWGHTGGGGDSQQGSPQPRHRRLARAVIHGCPAISENQLGTGNKQ